jgi:hypothetical protein
MSVSGLLASSTLNSIIPSGFAIIPAGQFLVVVPVPMSKSLIWADAIIQTSWFVNPDLLFDFPSDGTILSAYGGGTNGDGDTPSIFIFISAAQDHNTKVYWSVFSTGTEGNQPP